MGNSLKTPVESDKLAALGVSAGEVVHHPETKGWTLAVTVSVDAEGDSPLYWQSRRHPSLDWHTAHITTPQAQRRVFTFDLPGRYDIRLSTSTPAGVVFSPTLSFDVKDSDHG